MTAEWLKQPEPGNWLMTRGGMKDGALQPAQHDHEGERRSSHAGMGRVDRAGRQGTKRLHS